MTAADVREAVLRLYAAARDARAVSELPPEIGSLVHWANGVVWTRVGENAWLPNNVPAGAPEDHWLAPSLHVASAAAIVAAEPAKP